MFLEYAIAQAEQRQLVRKLFVGDREPKEAASMQLWRKTVDGEFFVTFKEDTNLIGKYQVDYPKRIVYGLHPLSVEELAVYFLYAIPCAVLNINVDLAKDCLGLWFERSLLYEHKDRALSVFDLLEIEN